MHSQLAKRTFAAPVPPAAQGGLQELFRARFKQALNACLEKGFLLEESFALIWQESLEEFTLSQVEQRDLRQELLEWARTRPNIA